MEKYEFLATPEGKECRYRYHLRKRVYLSYQQNSITTKKSPLSSKICIVRDTISQMIKMRKRSFLGGISCNVDITSLASSLPETYWITKNFLDLLSKKWVKEQSPIKGCGFSYDELARLPYIDDSQICYLSVNYSPSAKQGLNFSFSNFNNFLDDIAFAYEMRKVDHKKYHTEVDWGELYKGHVDNEKTLKDILGDDQYTQSMNRYGKWAEHQLWTQNKLGIDEIHEMLAHKHELRRHITPEFDGQLDLLSDARAEMCIDSILRSKYTVRLSDPCSSGFQGNLDTALIKFKKEILLNKDFDIPVGIQVFYRPFKEGQLKDLDNLSRAILTCFKNHFKNTCFKLFAGDLPNNYKDSIPCYEIIRLPFKSEANGFIFLRIFSIFHNMNRSLWDEIGLQFCGR